MDQATRRLVRLRAEQRCEYCRLRQEHEAFQLFQVEHIIARQHQGGDSLDNLALACVVCNSSKGPNLAGIDPDTHQHTRLFHPRQDVWHEHFAFDGPVIIGQTDIGRTTIWVLKMNSPARIELRRVLLALGEWD